jgi:hypothetical protein
MKRRLLWLAAPLVAGHAACIAFPAAAIALGLPVLMPICGEASLDWLAWNVRVALLGL